MVGLSLIAAAVIAVAMRHQDLAGALTALQRAPWWMVVLSFTLPLANWLLVSTALWIITSKHGPVRPGEMTALVAGAWLLNYLPMRPGMVGRIAYHRAVNGIPVATSMGLLLLSMGLTAGSIAILGVLGLAMRWADTLATEASIIASAGIALALASVVFRLTRGPWRVAGALLLRYLDMLVWVARYWIVFTLVGQRLTFEQACLIAAVSQAATAIPLAGNGLGIREWAVALFAASLPVWFATSGGGADPSDPGVVANTTTIALAADLINRGVEVAVALPVGLLGLAVVARRVHAKARAGVAQSVADRAAQPEPTDR